MSPLKQWVVADLEGSATTPHCNCMAGLGEACSNLGELLFALEAAVQFKEATAHHFCSWIQLQQSGKIYCNRGMNIDCTFPRQDATNNSRSTLQVRVVKHLNKEWEAASATNSGACC